MRTSPRHVQGHLRPAAADISQLSELPGSYQVTPPRPGKTARAALDKSCASQPTSGERQIMEESPGGPEPTSPAGSTDPDIEIMEVPAMGRRQGHDHKLAGGVSCGRWGYSPTVPSMASRIRSACPACRAVSSSRCSRTQPSVKCRPSRNVATDS